MAHNFNNLKLSFDVLEPIKAPVDPHRDVGTLIDINDNSEHDMNLSGSDLDNIKKAEFDLVDLFQNIYVTPQHIKKERDVDIDFLNEEASSSSVVCKPHHNDTVEVLEKVRSIGDSYPQFLNDVDVKRVLKVPTVVTKHEVDGGQEINNSATYSRVGRLDDTKRTDNLDCIATGIGNANYYKTLNPPIDGLFKKADNTGVLKKSLLENIRTLNAISPSDGSCNKLGLGIPFNNINCNKSIQKTDTKNQAKITMTITLDKKIYSKQKQTKNEIEKIGYTKAPDLSEKSVLLPQIMKRLDERNSLKIDFQRKELDSDKIVSQCQCKASRTPSEANVIQDKVGSTSKVSLNSKSFNLSPVIALENCNRERLIAHRVHSAFQRFVLTGTYY